MAGLTASDGDMRCVDHVIGGKCSAREADWVIANLAGQQHGVVARRQLLAAGIGRRAIDERMGRHRLHQIHRGVYAVGFRALRTEGRWMAAVLAAGPNAVLSHLTAAGLWGISPRSGGFLEVTRPTYFRPHPHIRAHRSVLPEDERTVVEGIPVTTVPRTVLDAAVAASPRQLERMLNETEVRGLTDALSVPDLLERYPRRPGSAVLHGLVAERAGDSGVTRNDFEELFVSLLDAHGLPRPRFNADISVGGRFFCVDCLWHSQRLIAELDGRAAHGTREAFEDDRERDRLLTVNGWRVLRITWRQVRDRAEDVALDVSMALEG